MPLRLGKKDKKVIKAFVDQKALDGHKLTTDGERLDGYWMGGNNLAYWKNGKIELPDSGSRAGQTVQNAVRRAAPANDLREKSMSKSKNPGYYERFTVEELTAMETISSGHMHNLKYDDGEVRYWLSRMTIEDGETFAVYVEKFYDGRWQDVHQYGEPQGYEEMFGNPGAPDKATRQLKNKLLR